MDSQYGDVGVSCSTRETTWDAKAVQPREQKTASADDGRGLAFNWNNWKLCGRETEMQQLEECYLTRKDTDLVVVTGAMGSGKSALTQSLHKRVRDDDGILCRGAFLQSQSSKPYAAFVEAFTDLVEQLQLKRDYATVRADVKQAIARSGAERFLISDGLSVLETLMNEEKIVEVLVDGVDQEDGVQEQQQQQ